eukprot:1441592-Prymnesium_polylepis.1
MENDAAAGDGVAHGAQDVDEVIDEPILELEEELLPFTRDNPAAVSLLQGLAGGHALDVHGQVSAALAVQVHRMFVGAAAAAPLASFGMQGVHSALRLLSLGRSAAALGQNAAEKEKKILQQRIAGAAGLLSQITTMIKNRNKPSNKVQQLKSTTPAQADAIILELWARSCPFWPWDEPLSNQPTPTSSMAVSPVSSPAS